MGWREIGKEKERKWTEVEVFPYRKSTKVGECSGLHMEYQR